MKALLVIAGLVILAGGVEAMLILAALALFAALHPHSANALIYALTFLLLANGALYMLLVHMGNPIADLRALLRGGKRK